ncbi:MAG: competence/damage-inducible protein A [Sedimentisphaerales bacterium]|nr:competence/damage-inducible protein A [Sedimentisphaerales bacterium]
MTRACIVSIGNELLNGQTVDTNTAWLTGRLAEMGIPTVACYTMPDDVEEIIAALSQAEARADIILITGGLGPTDDDLTRHALTRFLGVELELRIDLLETIEAFFRMRDRVMVAANRIQAQLPVGTLALDNTIGTAPGIFAEKDGKLLMCLPGVPSEMKQMFDLSVGPRLQTVGTGQVVISRKLHCFGTGESNIAQMLGDLMKRGRNPLINCTCGSGAITLHVVATASDHRQAEEMIERDRTKLCDILGELVYGFDGQSLAEVIGQKLIRQKKTLVTAESCTGGLIGKLLTDVPGSSRYFKGGWITYGNEAKIRDLSVDKELFEAHGAVSEQVAIAMAENARKRGRADIAVSTTGIAGPEGGTEQKPVGLVYIGVASVAGSRGFRHVFSHTRPDIRLRAALTTLNHIRGLLRN